METKVSRLLFYTNLCVLDVKTLAESREVRPCWPIRPGNVETLTVSAQALQKCGDSAGSRP